MVLPSCSSSSFVLADWVGGFVFLFVSFYERLDGWMDGCTGQRGRNLRADNDGCLILSMIFVRVHILRVKRGRINKC